MSEVAKEVTEKIVEHAKNLTVKSEVARVGLAVLGGLLVLLFLLPFFFNNSVLKLQITQKVSQITGANFNILGDVKIVLLPSPTIVVGDVLLRNYRVKSVGGAPDKIYNFYAKTTKIKLTVFKFAGDSSVKKIIFSDAIIQSYYDKGQMTARQDSFNELSKNILKNPSAKQRKSSSNITAKLFSISDLSSSEFSSSRLPKIVVKNGSAIIYDNFEKVKKVTQVNAEIKADKEQIFAAGDFNSEDIVSDFKLIAKFNSKSEKPKSSFELSSPVARINISGNFTSDNLGILASEFNGKIEAEIAEFKTFYKSYIGGSGAISDKLQYSSNPIKIAADINNKSSNIAITKLLINSSLVNGSGEVDLNFSDEAPVIDVDLDLENLDLDSMLSNEAVKAVPSNSYSSKISHSANEVAETLTQFISQTDGQKSQLIPAENDLATEEKSGLKLDFNLVKRIKNFELTAEIKIANIRFWNGEIKEANLYATVSKEGEVVISPLTFKVPGDGSFRVTGVIDNTSDSPKFLGKFDISGQSLKEIFQWLKIESQSLKLESLKSYQIYSDVLLLPNTTKLSNFYLNLSDNDSELLGDLTINNVEKSSNIKGRFAINKFNADDYFLTSTRSVYFAPGSLSRKLLWLNNITANSEFDLSFEKMSYKGEEFTDPSMKIKYGLGFFEISDLKLNSDKTALKADMLVDIGDQNPQFILKIAADNFHYETLQKSSAADSKKSEQQNFLNQFFDLPSLEGFNGRIDLNVTNAQLDNFSAKNFKLAGNVISGSIKSAELSCDLYGGSLSYNGMIGIGLNKVINGSLALNNASLQELLPAVSGIKNISGVANIAASVTVSAAKKEDFAKSLSGEIKFNANAPSVSGYGLNNLVMKMFAPQTNAQELSDPEKILLNPESVTTFKKANGSIKIESGEEGKFSINVSGVAVNAVLSGSLNVAQNTVNGLINIIFATGTKKKQIPISIATSIGGGLDEMSQSTNLDQVKQYLGLSKIAPMPARQISADTRASLLGPEAMSQQTSQIIKSPASTTSTQTNSAQ